MDRETFVAELRASPSLFPLLTTEDGAQIDLIRLTPERYERASFLDARLLRPDDKLYRVDWHEVVRAAAPLVPRCHFIFHISHVGSTLLSRLLGQHPDCLAIREPAVLRTFARAEIGDDSPITERLKTCLALWSRTYHPTQTSVIKATSFVNAIGQRLRARVPDSRVILMFIAPTTFLPALLGGAMVDITDQADGRLARLKRRLGELPCLTRPLTPGETVTMSWLSEMFSLNDIARRDGASVLWLDFDRFLFRPMEALSAVMDHLGLDHNDTLIRRILEGPLMKRYAKATDITYDASTRTELLAQASREQLVEIRRGLSWLERLATTNTSVAELLGQASRSADRF